MGLLDVLDDVPVVGSLKQLVVDDVGDAIQGARIANRKFDIVADQLGLWEEHDPKNKSFGNNLAALGNTALNAAALVPGIGAVKAASTGAKAGAKVIGKQIAVNSAKNDLKATKAALKSKGVKRFSFERLPILKDTVKQHPSQIMRTLEETFPDYFKKNYMTKTLLPRLVQNRAYTAATKGKKAALSAARYERNQAVKALPGVAKQMKGEAALIGTGTAAAFTPTERRVKTGKKIRKKYKQFKEWSKYNGQ